MPGKKFLGSTAGGNNGAVGADDFSDFNVDLAAINDELVADGRYRLKVAKAYPARSAAGKPQIKLVCELDSLVLDDGTYDPEGVEGTTIFDTLTFDPDNRTGMKINKKKLLALGVPEGPLNNIKQLCEDVRGVEVIGAVVQSYNPNNIDDRTKEPYPPQNRINMYYPIQA